jgi:predicted amidohydrolase
MLVAMLPIRAASVQFNHRPSDKSANLEIIRRFARLAAERRVDLLVFPEMCITGYWHVRKLACDAVVALSEPVPDGPSTQSLMALARESGLTIGAGLIERCTPNIGSCTVSSASIWRPGANSRSSTFLKDAGWGS